MLEKWGKFILKIIDYVCDITIRNKKQKLLTHLSLCCFRCEQVCLRSGPCMKTNNKGNCSPQFLCKYITSSNEYTNLPCLHRRHFKLVSRFPKISLELAYALNFAFCFVQIHLLGYFKKIFEFCCSSIFQKLNFLKIIAVASTHEQMCVINSKVSKKKIWKQNFLRSKLRMHEVGGLSKRSVESGDSRLRAL